MVLDAVPRVDGSPCDHSQDCIDLSLRRSLQEGAGLKILVVLEGELCIELGQVFPEEGIRRFHSSDPMAGKLHRKTALEGPVEPFNTAFSLIMTNY